MPTSADRFVDSAGMCAALKGREADLLDALGIPWNQGKPHINCPFNIYKCAR